MAKRIQDTKLRCCILVIIALSPLLCNRFVYGRTTVATKNIDLFKHKGTIKTIESEDGDMIDCVDIYQQPAFDHPALKNHIIQMVPYANYPSWIAGKSNESEVFQGLFKTVECPKGTIPIKRTQKDDYPPLITRQHSKSTDAVKRRTLLPASISFQWATVSVRGGKYNGATATFNLWNPKVEMAGEHSLAQLRIFTGQGDSMNSIEVGWTKNSPDDAVLPKLFIRWTADGYQQTGCYNYACPGFVQTNSNFFIDTTLSPVSTFGDQTQMETKIRIEKDMTNGHWWLYVQNMAIGYWPENIFTSLKGNSADNIEWGGEIGDSRPDGHHTTTRMGSGHFPREGYRRASYISNISYMDINGKFIDAKPNELFKFVSDSSCYDLQIGTSNVVFYGGPGYSTACP